MLTVSPSTLKPVVVRIPPLIFIMTIMWVEETPLPNLITNPSDLFKLTRFLFLNLTFVIFDSIAVLIHQYLLQD